MPVFHLHCSQITSYIKNNHTFVLLAQQIWINAEDFGHIKYMHITNRESAHIHIILNVETLIDCNPKEGQKKVKVKNVCNERYDWIHIVASNSVRCQKLAYKWMSQCPSLYFKGLNQNKWSAGRLGTDHRTQVADWNCKCSHPQNVSRWSSFYKSKHPWISHK